SQPPPTSTPFPYTTLFRSARCAPFAQLTDGLAHEEDQLGDHLFARRLRAVAFEDLLQRPRIALRGSAHHHGGRARRREHRLRLRDRKSTRLNSSHQIISYA